MGKSFFKYKRLFVCLIAIAGVVISNNPRSYALNNPQFLTLPFLDSEVKIQQGWYYTDGTLHKPKGAIDYIKGQLDDSTTWSSFDVVAAADGVAMQSSEKGYGIMVLIRHEETDMDGNRFFTLYAHLESDSIPNRIPFFERHSTNYDNWVPVKIGEVIGRVGHTGWSKCTTECDHLHFEVLRGGYYKNPTDPYDLQGLRDRYPCDNCTEEVSLCTGSNFTICGSNYLWTQCPPVVPPPMGDGLNSRWVDVNFPVTSLATAASVLSLGPGSPGYVAEQSFPIPSIDFGDRDPAHYCSFGCDGLVTGYTPTPYFDTFVGQMTGYIYIATEGNYFFNTLVDDGFRLMIDGQVVSFFDGLTGIRHVESTIHLTAGIHEIEMLAYENEGGFWNELTWRTSSLTAYELIPQEVFFTYNPFDTGIYPE